MSSTEEEEKPLSISSLRSKFENLAAANANEAGPSNYRRATPNGGITNKNQLGNGGANRSRSGSGVTPSGISISRPVSPPQLPRVEPTATPPVSASAKLSLPLSSISSTPVITSTPASPIPTINPDKVNQFEVSYGQDHAPLHDISPTQPITPCPATSSQQDFVKPRRAAPPVPPKSLSAPVTAVVDVTRIEEPEDFTTSVKALRERFNQSTAASENVVNVSMGVSNTDAPGAVAEKDIPVGESQVSPAEQELTRLNSRIEQAASPPRRSASPSGLEQRKAKPPPPPPPISRTASPAPIPIDRSTKPANTAVGDSSLPQSTVLPSQTLQTAESAGAEATWASQPLSKRPPIPVRKQTISIPIDTPAPPPPLPITKPIAQSASSTSLSSSLDATAIPPRLPERSRASSITRNDIPPRLPTRSATISMSQSLSGPSRGLASRARELSNASDYRPPPPPTRSTNNNFASPPRRERGASQSIPAVTNDDASSEYEDDEDSTPISGLTPTAKRMLEDYPDSTHANRRPPAFVPDLRISNMHHVNCHAIFGRYICLGAHHVRVYDTLISDRPVLTVELRDTGLEFRVKDPKITAMCFRPAGSGNEVDEGRYLWCGTKDGHLWELDVKSGVITDTKSFIHASAVTHILRYGQFVLTIEEGGKMNVFEVQPKEENGRMCWTPMLIRSMRIAEKFSYARLIHGKLWTAAPPAVRSTTNTSSKGPTIRVYEPCTREIMPPSRTVFTSEWTGSVTAATVIPFRQGEVYLGHEGGFVSIWDEENLDCLRVIKVSGTDVTALEGVGGRLWAGNRKGQIWVYDVETRPWNATNIWMAHGESAVNSLIVDPWSIEHSGRFTVWSMGRDAVRAWDGLLAVDRTDKEMTARQADYCSFRDINILVCSWNIDSAKPSDLAGSEVNAHFLDQVLGSVDSPDIIVFGFQEVIPLTDKKLTAKTLLFGSGKNKESGQTADKVSLAYRQWLDKLQYAVRLAMPVDCPYVKVHSESLVGLFTAVFVKSNQKEALRDIDICTVKRGIGGIYGNKGAIVARMVMDDTSLCFINVHLAAGQSQKAARNTDLGAIMEDKAILPASDELPFINGGDGMAILDHEIVILNGDLNYRIDQRRENVISSIAAGDLTYLLEHDQLRKEMRNNQSFRLRSFEEAPITFDPTYKYNTGSTEYDSSEKNRIPAWCDRILYTKSPRIENLNYQRYETTVSDHRPISAGFKVKIKAVDGSRMIAVRREIAGEWAKEEAELLERMSLAFKNLI